jgi:LysM repeat protein
MVLLEAHTSIINKKGTEEDETSLNIVADNALMPATGPLGTSDGTDIDNFSFDEISIYVVRNGDTISQVANMFGVSVDTILSANDMKKGDKLKEGDVLLILPFSGVEHTVAKGETLQGIASKYKVNLNDILSANDLDTGAKLIIGEKLMIPGADLLNTTKPKTSGGSIASKIPSVAGYFVNPVPGAVKSRGVKPGHKGVDFAAKTGTPIYAAASGTVLIARNGYNGGFGNYVVIQHYNGVKTLYAHMSKLGTAPGAKVSQGQVIGYVGNTGRSTGPHTHFEVIGAKNPF